jgi:enoyl-[acyl-carrier protein] reductase III
MQGKRVLVIGGTRGIGGAIAARIAADGAEVLVNYARNEDAALAFVDRAKQSGWQVKAVRGDVTSDKGREALIEAVAGLADLSGLIFSSATGVHKALMEVSGRHFDFTYALNVRAFLLIVQAMVPKMRAGASIVALSSEGAAHAMSHYGLVGSSKAALEGLCRQLAVELALLGIRVNILSPGAVRTDAWNVLPDAQQRLDAAAARTPRGSLVTLDEVACGAQFLVSDASSGLAGHTIVMDGGARIRGAG